jgi:hypothetical protein
MVLPLLEEFGTCPGNGAVGTPGDSSEAHPSRPLIRHRRGPDYFLILRNRGKQFYIGFRFNIFWVNGKNGCPPSIFFEVP